MAETTKIQWTDSTANPIQGCLGCELYTFSGELILKIDTALKETGNPAAGNIRAIFEDLRKTRHDTMLNIQSELYKSDKEGVVGHLTKIFLQNLKPLVPKKHKKQWDKVANTWEHQVKEELFAATIKWFKQTKQSLDGVDLDQILSEAHLVAKERIDNAVDKIKNQLTTSAIKSLLTDARKVIEKRFDGPTAEIVEQIVTTSTACYASELTRRYSLSVDNPLKGVNKGFAPEFEQITPATGEMAEAAAFKDLIGTYHPKQPWKSGLPRMIFISDMGDSLARNKDFPFLATEVLESVKSPRGSDHIWQWLTKRPEKIKRFADEHSDGMLPPNLMAMTTLTCWDEKNQTRLKDLKKAGAHLRGLSIEPQFDRIPGDEIDLSGIHWVILGGESGKGKFVRPFHLEWAVELVESCQKQGVAVFVKQWGTSPLWKGKEVKLKDDHGGEWDEWLECDDVPKKIAKTLHIREFPKAYYDYRPIPEMLKLERPVPGNVNLADYKLTKDEEDRFSKLDEDVKVGAMSVIVAAKALHEIKARKLYRADYPNFEAYCQTVHDMTRQHADRLEKAGMVALEMSPIGDKFGLSDEQIPKKESQLRELARVKDPEKRCEIVVEVTKSTDGNVTAKDFADYIDTHFKQPKKKTKSGPTPIQRIEKAREDFQRLHEIVNTLDYGEQNSEIEKLLKSIGKLLA